MEVGHRKGKFGFKAEPREVKPSKIQFEKSLFKCVSWGKKMFCVLCGFVHQELVGQSSRQRLFAQGLAFDSARSCQMCVGEPVSRVGL